MLCAMPLRLSLLTQLVAVAAIAACLDGVTKPLFDGKRVTDLWTGKLVATGTWTVRD